MKAWLLGLVLMAGPAAAQPVFTFPVGVPLSAEFDTLPGALGGDSYRLLINGLPPVADVPAVAGGTVARIGFGTLPQGQYTIAVTLLRPGIPEWPGTPVTLALDAQPPPAAPCTSAGSTFTCEVGHPRTLSFDASSPVVAGDVFRLHIAGPQVGPDIPGVVGTATYQVTLGATLAIGSYAITVGHVRPTFPEALSTPITLVLAAPPPIAPTAPGNLRIAQSASVAITITALNAAGEVLAVTPVVWVP